ncbi:hypothetical protein KO02_23135 [Sphingobacterium sp. ML3W]|nr:hypothetical protein KO02_23135 [Sphingobacterium sp. ML3W]
MHSKAGCMNAKVKCINAEVERMPYDKYRVKNTVIVGLSKFFIFSFTKKCVIRPAKAQLLFCNLARLDNSCIFILLIIPDGSILYNYFI